MSAVLLDTYAKRIGHPARSTAFRSGRRERVIWTRDRAAAEDLYRQGASVVRLADSLGEGFEVSWPVDARVAPRGAPAA